MRPYAALALLSLLAAPAAAQVRGDPKPTPSPKPTKVVSRSDQLVTARTSTGGTQSYNCLKPENARRAVCKGATAKPEVAPK